VGRWLPREWRPFSGERPEDLVPPGIDPEAVQSGNEGLGLDRDPPIPIDAGLVPGDSEAIGSPRTREIRLGGDQDAFLGFDQTDRVSLSRVVPFDHGFGMVVPAELPMARRVVVLISCTSMNCSWRARKPGSTPPAPSRTEDRPAGQRPIQPWLLRVPWV